MKHLKSIIAVLTVTIAFNFMQAQTKVSLENSVLWKIERSDIEKPSYIVGTMHMICEEDFEIPEKVTKTLENVDALVLEYNITDPTEIKALQESMMNAKKISDELTKEQFDKLDPLVTEIMGAPLVNFDQYGLSILHFFMIQKTLPCTPTQVKSVEQELLGLAKNKIPIDGLETFSDQVETLKNAYPTDYLLEQIMLIESYKKDFNDTVKAYKNENVTETVNLIAKKEYMNENAVHYMLIKRNQNWVEKIPEMMKNRSNLFAMGTAHLAREYGVINLLREKGFTVTPVLAQP